MAIASTLINGSKIQNHTIHKVKLAADALPKQGKTGPKGPAGADGATGPAGPQGSAGAFDLSKVALVQNSQTVPPGTDSLAISVACASGAKALGGGYNSGASAFVFDSQPSSGDTGWTADVFNSSGGSASTVTVYAICASS